MPVNDANVKVEANADALNGTANGTTKLKFEIPFFSVPSMFGGFAEQGAARAKENFEKMKVASEEIAEVLREACSTNAKGAGEYGAKVIEFSNTNASSTLEFLSQLADTKSLADVVNLSTTQSRRAIEAASAQNRELWEIARKVATDTAEPIKKGFDRALQKGD
jgi:phasin